MTKKNSRNKQNSDSNSKKNSHNRNKKRGGKVLGSGGFGCLFSPALQCAKNGKNMHDKNMDNKNVSNKVTKLMLIKNAKSEYEEIIKFQKILKKIPNYTDYFLVDNITICEPGPLTNEDLTNYEEKCKALNKKKITANNINESLNKVLALNMPNGGIDVGDFLKEHKTRSQLIMLNNSLIQLLVKGIKPMNELNVYHCDVKESNVLVQDEDKYNKKENEKIYTRLIDWGLSTNYSGDEPGIPNILIGRPFQYNVPFSIILFNEDFVKYYGKFLEKHENADYYMIREFVINYIFVWINIRGEGHLKLIHRTMARLFANEIPVIEDSKKEEFIIHDFTYYYIIEYLSKILEKYTRAQTFHMNEYFKDIFIKNIDVWGFVMIYMPFIEQYDEKHGNLTDHQVKLFEALKYIIVHFLFETPTEVIDTKGLVEELKKLDLFFSGVGQTKHSIHMSQNQSPNHSHSQKHSKTQKSSLKRSSMKTRSSRKQ